MPLFPGLNGSVSVRNFHLDDYPVHRRSSLRTRDDAQGDYKQGKNSDMMDVGESRPHTSRNLCVVSLTRFADLAGHPQYRRIAEHWQ
jgi:hypothetical protein